MEFPKVVFLFGKRTVCKGGCYDFVGSRQLGEMKKKRSGWNVRSAGIARNTFNPIRTLVEGMNLTPNPDKEMIALSIGDPTTFGNLSPPDQVIDAMVESVKSCRYNGYAASTGHAAAREAVAEYCSCSGSQVQVQDVILCSGCSHALDMCINVLAESGQNILVPRPGFSLYNTLASGMGINCRYYNLLPEKNWEVDLEHLESLIDSDTAAIIVNNPSNPCGSVFSKHHLLDILNVAARNYIPIIADEIYDNFVFDGYKFYFLASLSKDVPILSCGGLTKRFLIPGWRMGWVVIHDRNDVFGQEIRKGLNNLSQRIIGSNTLVQGALPRILRGTPKSFFDETINVVQKNAELAYECLSKCPGLKPIMPAGAMYMMVGIEIECFPEFKTDMEFVEQLVTEQSVFCLPGKVFEYPGYVRIVLTVPEEYMQEACNRISEFIHDHYKPDIFHKKGGQQEKAANNNNHHQNGHSQQNGKYHHKGKEAASHNGHATNGHCSVETESINESDEASENDEIVQDRIQCFRREVTIGK